MEIDIVKKSENIVSIKVRGEISVYEREELSRIFYKVMEEIDKPVKVQLDCSEVDYIDSIGISFLIKYKRELDKENTILELLSVQKPVKNIFTMLSLEKYFNFIDIE